MTTCLLNKLVAYVGAAFTEPFGPTEKKKFGENPASQKVGAVLVVKSILSFGYVVPYVVAD